MLCISVFMFFKSVQAIFSLDTFGRQADKYITHGGMFLMFFMYLCLPLKVIFHTNDVACCMHFSVEFLLRTGISLHKKTNVQSILSPM